MALIPMLDRSYRGFSPGAESILNDSVTTLYYPVTQRGRWTDHDFSSALGGMGLSLTGANIALGIGTIVAGKFRIERMLAEGGMGVVVAATHLQLEQTVALKFFRGDLGTTGEPLMRFMREAKAAAQLKSEHVARVLDVGVTEDATPYMVMEYLEGQGLEKIIASDGPMDISDAIEYAIQACEGLSEAHARGIVHRDIKPSNLFLAERSPGWRSIKILDFGISKVSLAQASNITTNLNIVMGTPCYMSPEQFQSAANVDHRTDIWSIGTTLYEMLAGKPPFDPTLPLLAIAEEIGHKEPLPLTERRPEVPPGLAYIVSRCMAKDREQRIASAAALANALLPFTRERARSVAERAAAMTPAFGFAEGESRTVTPVPFDDSRSGVEWTQIGFAGQTPLPIKESARPPAPPADTQESLFMSSGVAPLERRTPGGVRGWQPGGLAIGISASLLIGVVVYLALHAPAPARRTAATFPAMASAASSQAAPSADSPAQSELLVRVSPAAAQIMIDGAIVAGNPFRGRFQSGGNHKIQAFAPGYEPRVQIASLDTDVILDLSLERRQKPSLLSRPLPTFAPPAPARALTGLAGRAAPPRPFGPGRSSDAPSPHSQALALPDVVDPQGGRSPTHPIETRSPYKTP